MPGEARNSPPPRVSPQGSSRSRRRVGSPPHLPGRPWRRRGPNRRAVVRGIRRPRLGGIPRPPRGDPLRSRRYIRSRPTVDRSIRVTPRRGIRSGVRRIRSTPRRGIPRGLRCILRPVRSIRRGGGLPRDDTKEHSFSGGCRYPALYYKFYWVLYLNLFSKEYSAHFHHQVFNYIKS